MQRNCTYCSTDISHKHFNSTYCDIKCRNKDYANIRTEKIRIESIEFFKDKPITSYMECKICGHCATDLSNHILKIHLITCDEYKVNFNVQLVSSNDKCEKVRGKNNPGYQHGGKLSAFSDNFLYYDGSDAAKAKQKELKYRMNKNGTGNPIKNNCNIEYWLAKGYSIDEAKLQLSERQRVTVLSSCITKYGDTEGRRIWSERQNKVITSIIDSNAITNRISFSSLWRGEVDAVGIFYIIRLINNNIKIGISTANSVIKRYGVNNSEKNIAEILCEDKMHILRAFAFEQTIKKYFSNYTINKAEQLSDFGHTETFFINQDDIIKKYKELSANNVLYDELIKSYPSTINGKLSSVINEEKLNGTNNTSLDN